MVAAGRNVWWPAVSGGHAVTLVVVEEAISGGGCG